MRIGELREKSRELLQGALNHATKAGLAAALIPLGAAAVPTPANATTTTNLGQITGTTSGSSPSITYAFTIHNNNTSGGASISSFSLPIFSTSDVTAVSVTATGWSYTITTPTTSNWTYTAATDPALIGNPGKYGQNPAAFNTPADVIVFSTSTSADYVAAGNTLSGFSFTSQYSALAAPSQSLFTSSSALFDTDPPMPLSPARMVAQGLAVPEPASIVMAGTAGLVLSAGLAYRKWRGQRPATERD
jgi:hypothetical protein